MPVHLHIFEERYKRMIGRCLEERIPFGVVLIQSGAEVQGFGPSAQPHAVGCTAIITQMQPVGDGRMNIVAVGHERFRIDAHYNDEPYLTGDIEVLPLFGRDTPEIVTMARELGGWLHRYLQILERIEKTQFEMGNIPKDPISLSYLAASVIRLEAIEKQNLLAESDAARLVGILLSLYKREVVLLDIMSGAVGVPDLNSPFSMN
jgi:Lon protease-like protein